MARFTVGNGINDYIKDLTALATASDEMIRRSVYPAAGIVTDAVKAGIASIPGSMLKPGQREGLEAGLGIAPFRDDGGYIHVKVGMDGYNGRITKKYPNGQPNAMIARAINNGTSFSGKYPFIDRAVSSTRAKAEKMMAEEFDRLTAERFK